MTANGEVWGCAEVHERSGEIALELLSGTERAQALDHLERCRSCRAEVEALTDVVDQLLLAAPTAEPPPGFESRVLERLSTEAATPLDASAPAAASSAAAPVRSLRRRPGRWLGGAVAAAAVIAFVVAGFLVGRSQPAPEPTVRAAPMVTPAGDSVGRVQLGHDPDSVFVALPGWKRWAGHHYGRFRLRVVMHDGTTKSLGPVPLSSKKVSWGTVTRFDTGDVRRVAMVDADGKVFCRAVLS